jgi:hypothetical protein
MLIVSMRSTKAAPRMSRKFNLLILLALLAGWPISVQAGQKKALSERDLLELLAGGVYNARIAQLVQDRGINFVLTSRDLGSLRRAGADLALLNAVESARHVTAQLPERGKPHLQRQVTVPTVARPVESVPHNTLNVPPAASGMPRTTRSTAAKVLTQLPAPASSVALIPAGTTISLANWRQYSRYMPLGMMELFKGDQFWRMPADLEIVVGPTIPQKLPVGYVEATANIVIKCASSILVTDTTTYEITQAVSRFPIRRNRIKATNFWQTCGSPMFHTFLLAHRAIP